MASHNMLTVANEIRTILEDHQEDLGIKNVYFGDTPLQPDFPSVAIQTLRLTRDVHGTHKFTIAMEYELVLTVFKMGDPSGREESIHELIESITNLFDADRTLGGNVIFAMISAVDMVDVALGSMLIRGATMTIQTLSEEIF